MDSRNRPRHPEFAFHEAIGLFEDLGHDLTHPMAVALRVISMKYGLGPFAEADDERRDEERERERHVERINDPRAREEAELESEWIAAAAKLGSWPLVAAC